MRILNIITLLLIIVGGINWGLVGGFDFNLVDSIFGVGTGITRLIYILVGLSALVQLYYWVRALSDTPHTHVH